MVTDLITPDAPPASLVVRTAERYGIEPGKLLSTLKATAFRTEKPISNEQMMALLIVAERHRLDPFTKQIYAYPDKWGGIVPVVGVDGWLHIVNTHPMFDGMSFEWSAPEGSMTCTLWRKDRTHPIVVTEYLIECRRATEPWKMIHRMMRHKSLMQCARYAFGFSGIYDEDEAEDILRGVVPRHVAPREAPLSNAERFTRAVESQTIDMEPPAPPAADPDPAPDPAERAHTLADFLAIIEILDPGAVDGTLAEAKVELSPDEYAQLVEAFNARIPDGDPTP